MAWRVARSLLVLFDQLNAAAPGRSRASDGTIGDTAHQGTASDHNPRRISGAGSTPVVTAGDFTHDPRHGADMAEIAEALRRSEDRRISYVIWNRRIYSGRPGPRPWVWRSYYGDNPHTHHMHVSVVGTALCDNEAQWTIGEDDMPSVDDLLNADKIANDINPGKPGSAGYNPEMSVKWALRYASRAELVRRSVTTLSAQLAAMEARESARDAAQTELLRQVLAAVGQPLDEAVIGAIVTQVREAADQAGREATAAILQRLAAAEDADSDDVPDDDAAGGAGENADG